jgi:predicted GNAT family N-acyltransferase
MIDKRYSIHIADSEELRNQAFTIREEVFVQEQKVDKREEFDQFENISRHIVVLDEKGNGIGASRWRKTEKGIKLERFAVKATMRGYGIGQALVKFTLEDIQAQAGNGQYLYMHAQLAAVSLYKRFGFKEVGEQFEECEILHYKMELIN